jgi:hypothetical protein
MWEQYEQRSVNTANATTEANTTEANPQTKKTTPQTSYASVTGTGNTTIFHGPRSHTKRDKSGDNPLKTRLRLYAPRMRLAATAPEFVPQDHTLKMQAEIDALTRTLNELTLRAL